MDRLTSLIVLTALLAAGCAGTSAADKAATLAVEQLARYESDIGRKVRVENDYYDEVMLNAVKRINRLREGEHDTKLRALARRFAERQRSADPDEVAEALAAYFETAIDEWTTRETTYEQLLARTQTTLADNRKRLEVEQAKIRELRTKLLALREPGTTLDMLKLAVAFGKEVKAKLDELRAEADAAAVTATTSSGNAAKDAKGAK